MAPFTFLPEGFFPVSGTKPVTTNGGVTCDYISVKNANRVYIVVHLTQAVGHATAFAPYRATAVAPTGGAVLANVVPIWYGNVSTSSNALTRQTDAVNYTIGVGVTGEAYIIFAIDPASLGATYDVLGLVIADSSQATNIAEVTYWIEPKFASKTGNNIDYLTD
jgi:hypothetical protein